MTGHHRTDAPWRGASVCAPGLLVLVLGVVPGPIARGQTILVPFSVRRQRCEVSVTLRCTQPGQEGPRVVAGEALVPAGATLTWERAGDAAGRGLRCAAEVGEEWEELAFSFSVARDALAAIELRGGSVALYDGAPGEHEREQYGIADDLVLTRPGGEIDVNGSLECGAPLPEGWRPRGLAAIGESAAQARTGRRYAVVTRRHPVERRLLLSAGSTYTLRVWFRASREGCSRPAAKAPTSTVNVFVVPESSAAFPLRLGRVLVGPGGVTKIRRGVDKEECLNFRSAVGLTWQELAFCFSTEHDTIVSLELGGQWWPPRADAPWAEWMQRYLFVDDVSVSRDGKPLQLNGGFEKGPGSVAGWHLEGPAAVASDPTEARSGERSAVVSYHHRAATRFPVAAGQDYEVRLWYRAKPDGLVPWDGPGLGAAAGRGDRDGRGNERPTS